MSSWKETYPEQKKPQDNEFPFLAEFLSLKLKIGETEIQYYVLLDGETDSIKHYIVSKCVWIWQVLETVRYFIQSLCIVATQKTDTSGNKVISRSKSLYLSTSERIWIENGNHLAVLTEQEMKWTLQRNFLEIWINGSNNNHNDDNDS